MPAFDELLVGYRARDPRAQAYGDKYGGRCVDCGERCYFNASAFGILSGKSATGDDHDATIVCSWCYDHNRHWIDAAMASGA